MIIMRRMLVILFLLFFGYSNNLNAQDNSERQFNIKNCVSEFNPDSVVETEVDYQYWFVGKEFLDGRTLKMSVVAPHKATHAPHSHNEDEFFFVLDDKAEFYLNGDTKVAGPLTSFYCPPNSEHGIKNVGILN